SHALYKTLAKVYEDRAAECSRAAQQTDDPVFRRLLLMLASQWKFAAQEEAKSKDAPTSLASTQPQPSRRKPKPRRLTHSALRRPNGHCRAQVASQDALMSVPAGF